MKKSLLFGLLVLASGAYAQVAKLTVDQAVTGAIERSLTRQSLQSRYEQSRLQTRQALGLLGPRLDFQTNYDRYLEARPAFGPSGGSTSEAARTSLALSYPIDLVGVQRKAAKAASMNEQASFEAITAEEAKIRGRVRSAFYSVVRSEWQVLVAQESLTAAQDRLTNAKKRFNAGEIAKFDVLRLETAVEQSRATLDASQNGVMIVKGVLNNAMDLPADTPLDIEWPYADFRTVELPTYDLAEGKLLEIALANRAEIRQLDSFLQARRFVTYAERGGNSPSLRLQALGSHDFHPNGGPRNSSTISATLSFPIWDSGITKARIAAAKEDERQVELNKSQLQNGISLEVRSARYRLLNAASQLKFAKKVVELQREALRLAELRYSAREGILLDVTTADADLRAADGQLASAVTEYLTATSELQQALGTDQLPTLQP